ncbi:MAG: tagaturonate epimerase family protein, partial [Candidatus Jordarchaeaceae archaeon]
QDYLREFIFEKQDFFTLKNKKFGYIVCKCNSENASTLRRIFPFTRPRTIGLTPAIGLGDRLGLATPGHIRAIRGLKILPVLAQQSIREIERTKRMPQEVLDDVSWAVFQEGYRRGFAADADHL